MIVLLIKVSIVVAVLATSGLAGFALRRYFNRPPLLGIFDHIDAGISRPGPLLVEFTSPYCFECNEIKPMLSEAAGLARAEFVTIDAKDRPDLLDKYSIRTTPTVLLVDADGRVTHGWATTPDEEELSDALSRISA